MKLRGKLIEVRGSDVTDALARAMEKASELEATDVISILYNRREENRSYDLACVSNQAMTIETANWLVDKLKEWLLSEHGSD